MNRLTDTGSLSRRSFIAQSAATVTGAALLTTPFVAEAAPVRTFQVTGATAKAALDILTGLPYVSIGTGFPVYVMTSARCAICQGMYRQYPAEVAPLELRYVAIPFTLDESGELVRVWQSRSRSLFDAYLQHRLVGVPSIRDPNGGRMPSVPAALDNYFGRNFSKIEEVRSIFKRAYPSTFIAGTPMFFFGTPTLMMATGGNKMAFAAGVARQMISQGY